MGKQVFVLLFLPLWCGAQAIHWPQQPGVHRVEGISIDTLNRTRALWIYLPPNYTPFGFEAFPVLYAQDGQNLFEDSSSFAGEWHLDEQLDALYELGHSVPIVVALENGGEKRIDEYSPWTGKYGGGEGVAYAHFIVHELIPLIDRNYLTISHPSNRFLLGSSLGALINTYIWLKYPGRIAGNLAFSPAYWYNPEIMDMAKEQPSAQHPSFLFHVVGANEDSGNVVLQIRSLEELLTRPHSGRTLTAMHLVHEKGAHNEAYWSHAIPSAWLSVLRYGEVEKRSAEPSAQQVWQQIDCDSGSAYGRLTGRYRLPWKVNLPDCMEIGKLELLQE